MRKLILHIGIPKTGSSALQVFFARNVNAFRAKSVDYLPIGEISLGASGQISSGNGAYLSRCVLPLGAPGRILDGDRHVKEFLDAVRHSTADIGVVSSELFVFADPQMLSALLAQVRELGIIVKCFYYIRSQIQFLSSAYMQQVKRHSCVELPATYIARTYKDSPFLKHYPFYLQQCDLYGVDNVICRVYENAISVPGGLFTSILSALNIDPSGLDFAVKDVNTSISARDLGIMLVLNRLHPRMKFSDMVVENAAQFGSASSGQIHNLIPHDLASEIDAYFEEDNSKLAQSYFFRNVLFPESYATSAPADISVESLSSQDLIAFFGGLLVRYDERLARLEASDRVD